MAESQPQALSTILVRELPAWRVGKIGQASAASASAVERRSEQVVVEATVALTVNGRTLLRFSCLPARLDDLALGFLIDEGLIERPGQVRTLEVTPDEVRVEADIDFGKLVNFFESVTMVSGCGRGGSTSGPGTVAPVASRARLSPEECLAMMGELERASQLFKVTGGVHLAALSRGDGLLDVAEDIGRHNAVDKVIGRALRLAGESPDRPSLKELMLLTTGRLSSEIAAKAVRVGLPMVVSRSAPTSAAVELAREADLCLVGFARGRRLNVYSAPWRLGISEDGARPRRGE